MPIAETTSRQSKMIVASVMLGLFLGGMEATVVATALPTIVAKLSGLQLYSWPMAIYILASAATGPLFGKLSDLYGRKNLYLFSLFLFLLGSALCGFSQNMIQLVFFRALQGLGAGGVLPLAIIIAGDMFPFEKRAKVQPLFTMVWGLASLVGPPLGAWLASVDWRLVFFVNIPFGILSGILLSTFLHETRPNRSTAKIDYLGAVLLTVGILGFELALPGSNGFPVSPWQYAAGGLSLSLLAVFVLLERTAPEPILPLPLLRERMISSASLCQFFTGMALFGSLSFLPLYVQTVMGLGIHGTGKVLTWFLLSWVFFSFLSSRIMLKIGYRFLVTTGSMLLFLGFLILTRFMGESGAAEMNLAVTLLGAGMGWIMAPLIVAVQSSTPKKYLGIATSSQVLFRTVGASVGVSIMGSIMVSRMQQSLHALLANSKDSSLRESLVSLFNKPNQVMDPLLRGQLPQPLLTAVKSTMAFSLHGVFTAALVAAFFVVAAGFMVPGGKAEKHFYQEPAQE